MSISKRQEEILSILREKRHISVESLAKITYTSPSSIRRDLMHLQNISLVKRTHGGVSIVGDGTDVAPLDYRMTQNTLAKKKIAKKASSLICDGQTILLDGSSSASFMIPYIAQHKDILLYTNNMITAINAIGYGIKTSCIGGMSVNGSAVLSGVESYREVSRLNADILFFSSYGIDERGIITDPTEEENYLRSLMIERAARSVFLCDSEKFSRRALHTLTELDNIYAAAFDIPYNGLTVEKTILL